MADEKSNDKAKAETAKASKDDVVYYVGSTKEYAVRAAQADGVSKQFARAIDDLDDLPDKTKIRKVVIPGDRSVLWTELDRFTVKE